ncbi:hypothetical protein DB347_15445 [Opitutaceae bacterium EW11]|nr:hypothetical protein DB347_15445 [Opitutaceae bacterium EW11]
MLDQVAPIKNVEAEESPRRKVLSFEAFNLGLTRHWLEQARQDVPLTDEEVERLVGTVSEAISILGAFELSIARINATADRIHVEVPPYPKAGDRIIEILKEGFSQAIGAERAGRIWLALQENLSAEFNRFGQGQQTIDATLADSAGKGRQYRIERRIEWISSEGPKSTASQLLISEDTLSDMDYIALAPYLRRLTK